MQFGEFIFLEVRNIAESEALAVIPTGCTEQQGPHLPVDFDTWLVQVVCVAAAQRAFEKYRVNALVLPALPFGPTPEHRNFGSGYIDIPQVLFEEIVTSILNSLAEQNFRRIVVWRGCGQHMLDNVIATFNQAHFGRARAFQPGLPYAQIMHQVAPGIVGGHADSFSTSLALHLRPQSVRVDQIPAPETQAVDWNDPQLDFARYSTNGVIGDATRASAELGARLWERIVETVASTFAGIAQTSLAIQP